jgi:hypothetical protein
MGPVLKRTGVVLTSLALAMYAAACDSGTGPSANFDPQTTATSVQEVVGAFQANQDALASMNLASQALGASMAAQMLPKDPGQILPSPAAVQSIANDLTVQAIFPSNALGVTFVYDTAQAMYVPSDLTGAPTNGVRVIYYAVDPVTNAPVEPLNALGYVDLTDESTAASTRLGITIVQTGDTDVTLADYYIDAAYTQTQTDLGVQLASVGYVSNGTDELDFDLSETLTLSSTTGMQITMDYQASLAGQDVSVRFQGTGSVDAQGNSSTMNITFTLQNGADQVVLDVTITGDTTLEGTLAFNGNTVMNLSGTTDNPSFTKPDGSALTQSDVTALQNIWSSVSDLFTIVGDLFGPATG